MPVVRIDDKGITVADKRKALAKKSSIGLVGVGAISVITYMYVSPEAGVMVGLLLPTIASLLNLWSE
tara:strand:- start:803 stop:1003 length:201 start_codon:yes stop_codon:yes gene_type:complete